MDRRERVQRHPDQRPHKQRRKSVPEIPPEKYRKRPRSHRIDRALHRRGIGRPLQYLLVLPVDHLKGRLCRADPPGKIIQPVKLPHVRPVAQNSTRLRDPLPLLRLQRHDNT